MRRFLLLFIAALIALPALPAGSLSASEKGKETELEKVMGQMNGAFRKLRRQVADASKNAESLQLVATVRKAAEDSITLVPALAADKPEADRPAFIAAYREQMRGFISALAPLETALKAGDNAKAEATLAELLALQKKGHKEYKKPE
jgi:soluble cytochrome b562